MDLQHLSSETAGNKLRFPDMKQQLLEFEIECGFAFDIVVVVNGDSLMQKFIYKQFGNIKSL